jgi:hypothetical protein
MTETEEKERAERFAEYRASHKKGQIAHGIKPDTAEWVDSHIEVPTLDGDTDSFLVRDIQFFWQKIVSREPLQLVTQIYIEEFHRAYTLPYRSAQIPFTVETPLSVDAVRDLIVATGYDNFLVLHRAYTRHDDRVIVRFNSQTTTAIINGVREERAWAEGLISRREKLLEQASHDYCYGSLVDDFDYRDIRIGFGCFDGRLLAPDEKNMRNGSSAGLLLTDSPEYIREVFEAGMAKHLVDFAEVIKHGREVLNAKVAKILADSADREHIACRDLLVPQS